MKKYWTMKTGETIRIKDMEDQHLKNTLAMLEKNAKHVHSQELNACMSIGFQGEQAEQDQEHFILTSDWEDYLPEVYYSLQSEALKRKIIKI